MMHGPSVPSLGQLSSIAARLGFDIDERDLVWFRTLIAESLDSYSRVGELAQITASAEVSVSRDKGHRASPAENPLNAWYWKCSIKGASQGPLFGKRIAAKDNICVAGIPMMNGTVVLEGYVPEFDATIVSRSLLAGAEIVGKAVCESLSFGGSSFTADTGPVLNPHDLSRTTGGSSSGAAALVAIGECDAALAADQGGSIRIPSAWCGVIGLKPTYGLLPYTGIFPSELTLDHAGVIARTTEDVALVLQATAGRDGLDPRQTEMARVLDLDQISRGAANLKVGVLSEGFGWPASERDVDESVRDAAGVLSTAGATVTEVSIPSHRDGRHIWRVIGAEGRTETMIRGNGLGTNWKGFYAVSMLEAFAAGRKRVSNRLSDSVKLIGLLGEYMRNEYGGSYYAKAQNQARILSDRIDEAFQDVDALLLPTAPLKAIRLPGSDVTREERIRQSLVMAPNTCTFNITGHPAISVPCGRSEGLPIGVMLVGRRWEEGTLLRLARGLEDARLYDSSPVSKPAVTSPKPIA
jgi:amidase